MLSRQQCPAGSIGCSNFSRNPSPNPPAPITFQLPAETTMNTVNHTMPADPTAHGTPVRRSRPGAPNSDSARTLNLPQIQESHGCPHPSGHLQNLPVAPDVRRGTLRSRAESASSRRRLQWLGLDLQTALSARSLNPWETRGAARPAGACLTAALTPIWKSALRLSVVLLNLLVPLHFALAANQEIHVPYGYLDKVNLMAISPDGRLLATCWDGVFDCYKPTDTSVKLWNAKTGTFIKRLGGDYSIVRQLAFSPRGDLLAGVADMAYDRDGVMLTNFTTRPPCVILWDTETGEVARRLEGHSNVVRSVAFSGDGNLIATSGGDEHVKIWSASTGNPVRTIQVEWTEGYIPPTSGVALSDDGRLVAVACVGKQAEIGVWDIQNGGWLGMIEDSRHARELVYGRGGRIASTSYYRTRFWDMTRRSLINDFINDMDPDPGVSFSPDMRSVAFGDYRDGDAGEDKLLIYDLVSGRGILSIKHPGVPFAIVHSPDGQSIITAGDQGVFFWDAGNGNRKNGLKTTPGRFSRARITYSPDGKFLAIPENNQLRVWDLHHAKMIRTISENVDRVCFSPDSQKLYTFAGEIFRITILSGQETNDSKRPRLHQGRGRSTRSVISPDGRLVASLERDLPVLGLDTPGLYTSKDSQWPETYDLERDGRFRFRVREIGGEQLFNGKSTENHPLAFTPDSMMLITEDPDSLVRESPQGRTRTLRFWRVKDGYEERVLNLPEGYAFAAISPHGIVAATFWGLSKCRSGEVR